MIPLGMCHNPDGDRFQTSAHVKHRPSWKNIPLLLKVFSILASEYCNAEILIILTGKLILT